jgi:hypothetical protein
MRVYFTGVLMIPLVLLLIGMLAMLNGSGIIHFARAWTLWPVTLIATGLEEIYLWAVSKNGHGSGPEC